MKKIILALTVIALATGVQAQKYKDIADKLLLGQYDEARKQVDKGMGDAKFTSKPDAYILKTAVYTGLASNPANAAQAGQLRDDAYAAFLKYVEMQPDLSLAEDLPYKNGPLDLHTLYLQEGYKDYQEKKWSEGLNSLEKSIAISDLLIPKKIMNITFDTTTIILAAACAANADKKDEAAKYYKRMADANFSGPDYEDVYRYMVRYSFGKKDMAGFEKYRKQGKQLYPNSEFFDYDQTDFAVGLEENFNAKLSYLDEVLAANPNDYKANFSLGQLIYDTLYSLREGAVKPANAAELEPKMVAAFTRAQQAKPDDVWPYLYLGDYYTKRVAAIDEARSAHVEDMKKRTKPTAAPSKEDVAKRDALDKQLVEAYDQVLAPYEKAAEIFAKKESLTGPEKRQYKNVAGYLGDIYTFKKTKAKGNAAELAKLTEQERKWNDLYGSIK